MSDLENSFVTAEADIESAAERLAQAGDTIHNYADLPEPVRDFLMELEGFIGDTDGHELDDGGTVDATEAVAALNGLIAELRITRSQLVKAKTALKPFAAITVGVDGDESDLWFKHDGDQLLIGDFRAAKSALTDD